MYQNTFKNIFAFTSIGSWNKSNHFNTVKKFRHWKKYFLELSELFYRIVLCILYDYISIKQVVVIYFYCLTFNSNG